jgi:hypothetical protein
MPNDCPEAVHGWHSSPTDTSGRCLWCRRKVERAAPRPADNTFKTSNLTDAYRRQWDPDWGTDPRDHDPA